MGSSGLKPMAPMIRTLAPMVAAMPKIADALYTSPEWRALVRDIKRMRGNFCQRCGKGGRIIGDHIVEVKDGGAQIDPSNVELLCIGCHNGKTAKAKARRAGR